MKQSMHFFPEGESPTLSVCITIPYESIRILVLLLLQHGYFSYKYRFSCCDASWRGAALLGWSLTLIRVLKGAAKVLCLLEEM